MLSLILNKVNLFNKKRADKVKCELYYLKEVFLHKKINMLKFK